MNFSHKPVLLEETINGLNINPEGIYVDGTAGGGGHSEEILKKLTTGKLICIDQDPDAIQTLTKKFENDDNAIVIKGNFGNIKSLLKIMGLKVVDGVLLDIGVSSHQLDTPDRGFSFHEDAPLDMRMSQTGETAADLVNNLSFEDLTRILRVYGEERYAASIVNGIIKQREIKPIKTTLQLAEIIKNSVPQRVRRKGHPARKSFQALRIAVNKELDMLEKGMDQSFEILSKNGRLAIITFHSLEDRIVKHKMVSWCEGCTCPPDFPICVCGNKPKAKLINRKPIQASKEELEENNRSRSAKLRVCKKL